jgi:hypothetical protein
MEGDPASALPNCGLSTPSLCLSLLRSSVPSLIYKLAPTQLRLYCVLLRVSRRIQCASASAALCILARAVLLQHISESLSLPPRASGPYASALSDRAVEAVR